MCRYTHPTAEERNSMMGASRDRPPGSGSPGGDGALPEGERPRGRRPPRRGCANGPGPRGMIVPHGKAYATRRNHHGRKDEGYRRGCPWPRD